MAETPMRHVRVPDELWNRSLEISKARGETVSDALRRFLEDYADENLPGYTAGFAAGLEAGKRDGARMAAERVRTAAETAVAAVATAAVQE